MLREAGIAVWMLTGDKFETAKQIALCSRLIYQEQPLIHIQGTNAEQVSQSLSQAHKEIKSLISLQGNKKNYSVIITGATLPIACDNFYKDFDEIILGASSVICCRVSPSQKARIVQIIKMHNKVTLAIGDGGNDVSMIQEAHIGVGIYGKEGLQAALASDFSIGKFKHIVPLLLVHGHYSHNRISFIAQFVFYKNIVLALLQVLYNMFTNFSGASAYLDLSLAGYNFLWTGLYVFTFMLDRDVDKNVLLSHPRMYKYTQQSKSLGIRSFLLWISTAIFHAVSILLITVYSYMDHGVPSSIDKDYFGVVAFTSILFVVAITYFIVGRSIHIVNTSVIFITQALYFVFLFGFDHLLYVKHMYPTIPVLPGTYNIFGVVTNMFRDPMFYMVTLLSVIVCELPVLIACMGKIIFLPSVIEKYQWRVAMTKTRSLTSFTSENLMYYEINAGDHTPQPLLNSSADVIDFDSSDSNESRKLL